MNAQVVTASKPDGDGMVVLTPGTINPGYTGQRVNLPSIAAQFPTDSRERAIILLNSALREQEITARPGGQVTFHNTPYDVKRTIPNDSSSPWAIDFSKQLANAVNCPTHAASPDQGKAWIDALPVPNELWKGPQSDPSKKGQSDYAKNREAKRAAKAARKGQS